MKINSNKVVIEKEAHSELEQIIAKIASDNGIDNVEEVKISLTKDGGIISFKEAFVSPEVISDIQNLPQQFNIKALPAGYVDKIKAHKQALESELAQSTTNRDVAGRINIYLQKINQFLQAYAAQEQSNWNQDSFAPAQNM
jgi:hypothetical protein